MSGLGATTARGDVHPAGARARRLTPLIAAVWAAAAAGAALGAVALTGDDSPRRAGSAAAPAPAAGAPAPAGSRPAPGGDRGLGDRIRMSFGVASVGSVVRLAGPPEIMGVRLRSGERAYQAQLTLVNLRRRPVVYAPSLLRLDAPRGLGDVRVATGSAEGGRIESLTSHRFAIRFALADGAPLPRLRLRDPAAKRTSVVSLGSAGGLETLDLGKHHLGIDSSTGGRRR